jgi:hypothetical protein
MAETIIGRFSNRRDADLAIENLVQDHGIERTDVFAQPASSANSAGEVTAGADVESGHPGVSKDGQAALEGPIDISVDVNDASAETVRAALTDAGGTLVAA